MVARGQVCIDKFAHCTGGDCANKNLDLLSPRNDAFFSRLTTTGPSETLHPAT